MKDYTIEFSNDSKEIKTVHIECYSQELKKCMWAIMEGILKQIKCKGKNDVIDWYDTDYTGITIGLQTTKGAGWVKTFIEY